MSRPSVSINHNLPRDASQEPMQLTPAVEALATTVDASITTATTITLNPATSFLEVTAKTGGVFLKYGTGASNSDFDEYIASGVTRQYKVPVDNDGNFIPAISVIQDDSGAAVIVIEK